MSLQPLNSHLVIRPIAEDETRSPSGLIVAPQNTRNVRKAEILSVGRSNQQINHPSTTFSVGEIILYYADAERYSDTLEGTAIIPAEAVLAFVPDGADHVARGSSDFFSLPPWEEFKLNDHERWRDYTNASLFSFKVKFLHPFIDISDIATLMYEYVVEELRSTADIDLDNVHFRVEHVEEEGRKDTIYAVTSSDDKWDGAISLSTALNALQFTKRGATLQNLHETVPGWMRAFFRVINSPAFQRIAGPGYSRIQNVVIGMDQEVLLQGRGIRKEPVINSDLMEQFLLLGSTNDPTPATLAALGIPVGGVRRVDIKLGYERPIDGHDYIIFMDVKAPSNDEHSHIRIEWQIQDHRPGDLSKREYGSMFVTFFRDIVFRSFYTRWFQENADIACVTELK